MHECRAVGIVPIAAMDRVRTRLRGWMDGWMDEWMAG